MAVVLRHSRRRRVAYDRPTDDPGNAAKSDGPGRLPSSHRSTSHLQARHPRGPAFGKQTCRHPRILPGSGSLGSETSRRQMNVSWRLLSEQPLPEFEEVAVHRMTFVGHVLLCGISKPETWPWPPPPMAPPARDTPVGPGRHQCSRCQKVVPGGPRGTETTSWPSVVCTWWLAPPALESGLVYRRTATRTVTSTPR